MIIGPGPPARNRVRHGFAFGELLSQLATEAEIAGARLGDGRKLSGPWPGC
ncbi:MAG: hypothetical protein ACXW0R_07375 [Gaiellaceae bacterium]